MPRNLERRVEVIVPVEDRLLQKRLRALLGTCLADNRQAWELYADGTYVQRTPGDEPEVATHRKLLRDPWGLDRADSRYTTSEMRAYVPLVGETEPNGNAVAPVPSNGRAKGKRTTRR